MRRREIPDHIELAHWAGEYHASLTLHQGAPEEQTYHAHGQTRLGAIWMAYRQAHWHQRHKHKLKGQR